MQIPFKSNLIYFGVIILALFTIAQASNLERRGKHKKGPKGRARGLSQSHPKGGRKGNRGFQVGAVGGTHSGFATFYFLQRGGRPSCDVKVRSDDLVVALSRQIMGGYRGSNCGKTINVHGDHGSVTVRVIDTCARCGFNDIDLSPEAFRKIANKQQGKVRVSWSFN
jgi:expansin (peptidoglycan-binding protein)